jgi:phosphotransferase system, enzyme I, PtsP
LPANDIAILQTDHSRLMRRMREVLGGANLSSQEKLDQLVHIISNEMHSDVCSVYIKSTGDVLILFATEGLNPLSVHYTRLRVGEGVIGDVAANARPLSLSDIKSHPNFAYRPETGEDALHGFLGVPICRGGRVLGVMALQTREKRFYTFEEVDLMQTVSMVLAELISSREYLPLELLRAEESLSWLSTELSGFSLNPGIATGTAVFHHVFQSYSRKSAASIHKEKRRLQRSMIAMQMSLNELFSRNDLGGTGDHQEIFEVYRMLAFDRGWHHRLNQAIEQGLSAEAAVEKVLSDMKRMMSKAGDAYWHARLVDFEDLSGRLLQYLSGHMHKLMQPMGDEKIILIARSMGPAELLDYEQGSVAGLVIEEGMQSAHVSIVARALEIPVVARIPGVLLKIEPGDKLLVDGDKGTVIVRPGSKLLATYEARVKARKKALEQIQGVISEQAVTKDGVKITLRLNAGLPMDVDRLDALGVEGVGLYRTEIPFMLESSLPDINSQRALYKDILAKAKGKPVIFRTLDIGGDKLVPYIEMPKAENPAMGWRAVRISLDRPALFRFQIRALLQAAVGAELYIMIPMVTTTSEFVKARKLIDQEIEQAKARLESMPVSIKVGAMLEVPSLAYELNTLLAKVDFLSIGTNDLLQFFYATDRSNVLLNKLYDPLSFGFLSFLRNILRSCEMEKVPVHICGELASFPVEALVLLGLGFKSLSISAASVGRVKLMIRGLHLGDFQIYLNRLLNQFSDNIRHECQAYAQDHSVIL